MFETALSVESQSHVAKDGAFAAEGVNITVGPQPFGGADQTLEPMASRLVRAKDVGEDSQPFAHLRACDTPGHTPGTLIATQRGAVPVERLEVGDRVITRDNGFQTVRWTGAQPVAQDALLRSEEARPVRVRAHALGQNSPAVDTLFSPNHRLLLTGARARRLFGESEGLVEASVLTGSAGVDRVIPKALTYICALFDDHQVILANGAWTESFRPGDNAMRGISADLRAEIYALFPELKTRQGRARYAPARAILRRDEAGLGAIRP